MATENVSSSFEARLTRFLEWVDGPAGIKRPTEIKILQSEDETRGVIGILDIKATQPADDEDLHDGPPSKRAVRAVLANHSCLKLANCLFFDS